jgi:phosphomannomutase/phosphoglucomutase
MTSISTESPIDPGIFKAYDVRGVVDKTLTEAAARSIGSASSSAATGASRGRGSWPRSPKA